MDWLVQLEQLKQLLDESNDDERQLTDERLALYLEAARGNVMEAAYLGAMAKARDDGITLPDGTTLPSNRAYWLSMAATFRRNRSGTARRADEVRDHAD